MTKGDWIILSDKICLTLFVFETATPRVKDERSTKYATQALQKDFFQKCCFIVNSSVMWPRYKTLYNSRLQNNNVKMNTVC